ncbi:MAG: SDR family NAD(P)-dependent oxidoreductase [Catenulispora sp.]|nr:SDR family NAD(P)-dependent oxidoreductase [Catenulispora sp.]
MSVFFITGAPRGLGLEIARAAAERGHTVVATARDADAVRAALPAATALPLDVTDAGQARAAVEAAVAAHGRIDVLVNNAGYGMFGAVEEVSDAEARAIFDANVFGLLTVTRAVLPVMRAQRSGRVLNIGSIAGFFNAPGPGLYGATKFAVDGISEAMRGELEPLGILTTVVEPGALRTGFFGDRSFRFAEQVIGDYAATVGRARAAVPGRDGTQPGDPAKAAGLIVDLAEHPEPPTRLLLGSDAVTRADAKLEHLAEELAQWREASLSTDF